MRYVDRRSTTMTRADESGLDSIAAARARRLSSTGVQAALSVLGLPGRARALPLAELRQPCSLLERSSVHPLVDSKVALATHGSHGSSTAPIGKIVVVP